MSRDVRIEWSMKVFPYPALSQIMNRVTEANSDKQGGAGSNAYQQQEQKKKDEKEYEATAENVQDAIETFASDAQMQSQGITASADGEGPGLKVLLKDATGGVLRAVSGEEFLKLREAIHAGKKSGRILDQKA